MAKDAGYLRARRRYAAVHMGIMLALFALAFLGVFLVPLELVWRIGYAVGATVVLVLGVLLSRWWILQRMQARIHELRTQGEDPDTD